MSSDEVAGRALSSSRKRARSSSPELSRPVTHHLPLSGGGGTSSMESDLVPGSDEESMSVTGIKSLHPPPLSAQQELICQGCFLSFALHTTGLKTHPNWDWKCANCEHLLVANQFPVYNWMDTDVEE